MSQPFQSANLKSYKSDKLIKLLAFILLGALALIALVLSLYFKNFTGELSTENEVWGAFGDFVGGTLNPILSFCALIALLLTIILQSRELEATREELSRSATAHEDSQKVMAEQHKTLEKQKFESTFFSLLELHNQSLTKVCEKPANELSGSEMQFIWDLVLTREDLESAKKELEEATKGPIGGYFRVLYQLLKFIVTNSPDALSSSLTFKELLSQPVTKNEKMYSSMIRAFVPNQALQLLAINCYCLDESDSYWTYKLLVERFEFLEHMPFAINYSNQKVLEPLLNYYDNAFGESDYIISSNGVGQQ